MEGKMNPVEFPKGWILLITSPRFFLFCFFQSYSAPCFSCWVVVRSNDFLRFKFGIFGMNNTSYGVLHISITPNEIFYSDLT